MVSYLFFGVPNELMENVEQESKRERERDTMRQKILGEQREATSAHTKCEIHRNQPK